MYVVKNKNMFANKKETKRRNTEINTKEDKEEDGYILNTVELDNPFASR